MTTHRGEPDLDAGGFSTWLREVRAALDGDDGTDVPCGSCTACCRSSQFVHIGPDETATLAVIPAELLFPAPGLPAGHVLMGYDGQGACPMLTERGCSIYDHRPRTCRTYDCRVFAATGVEADDDKPQIGDRVRRWRFTHPSEDDRAEHEAVRAAAVFTSAHADAFPPTARPANATQRAVLAVEVADAFLRTDASSGRTTVTAPSVDEVLVVLDRRRRARRSA